MKIIDLYLNSKKFTYGSVVSKYNNRYLISVGRNKTFLGDSFKEVLIKSTNNYLLKFLFLFCDFDIDDRYYRNQFSGSKYKTNWKKLSNCTHLAWEVGGKPNNEHKYLSKVKKNKK